MHCHVCNVAVGDGQKFCHACGESLAGVTDPTQPISKIDDTTLERIPDADADTGPGAVALPSETVDPPPVPEPGPASPHAGALPDLATPAPPTDDEWFARLGPPDPATMPQPPTQPIDEVDSEPGDSTPVTGLAAQPEPVDLVIAAEEIDSAEVWATAAPYDTDLNDLVGGAAQTSAPDSTTTMPITAPTAGVGPEAGVVTDEFAAAGTATSAMPVFDGGSDVDAYAAGHRPEDPQGFRLRASFVFALLAVVTVLMASVAEIVDIRTSRPVDGIAVGFRTMDDLATNLAVAGFVGAALMLVGGLLSCFGLRWGAGLAGGAGLSLVGWAAVVLGLVEIPVFRAQQVTREATSEVSPFTLSITRDLGWFLVVAAAVLGVIVFLASLRQAGAGTRRGLNPWVAALGALAMVIAAAGPLIPLGDNGFDVNLQLDMFPRAFFAARFVQVGLLAVTGVIGFLSVRNFGLGFAAGGIGVSIWLWVTSLIELGDVPASVAVGNIGTESSVPHGVTSVGMCAAIALLLIAAALSFATRPRRI